MSLLAYSNNKQPGKQKVYGVPSAFSMDRGYLTDILIGRDEKLIKIFKKI